MPLPFHFSRGEDFSSRAPIERLLEHGSYLYYGGFDQIIRDVNDLISRIKNEPNDYLKKSHLLPFNGFLLRIPSWWTTIINKNDLIRFERTDTRYDWFAEFWIKETSLAPEILLTKLINSLKVTFDDNDDFEQFTLKSSNDRSINITRKEGMSTIDGIERAYFDLFIASIEDNKVLVGKSHSSILNGCVEGPYFEEVLRRLDLASTSRESSNS